MDIYICVMEVDINFILVLNKNNASMIIAKGLYLRIIYNLNKE